MSLGSLLYSIIETYTYDKEQTIKDAMNDLVSKKIMNLPSDAQIRHRAIVVEPLRPRITAARQSTNCYIHFWSLLRILWLTSTPDVNLLGLLVQESLIKLPLRWKVSYITQR